MFVLSTSTFSRTKIFFKAFKIIDSLDFLTTTRVSLLVVRSSYFLSTSSILDK